MAAIDPSATPEHTGTTNGNSAPRATLKIVYDPHGPSDEDSDDSEDSEETPDFLKALLGGLEDKGMSDDEDDDDDSSNDDEEKNGGPSDPSKSKKARKEAAVQQMMQALAENDNEDDEDDMDVDKLAEGAKGKGKATAKVLEDEDVENAEGEDVDEMEELVICTLDPEKVPSPANPPTKSRVTDSPSRIASNPLTLPFQKISVPILKSPVPTRSTLRAIMSFLQMMVLRERRACTIAKMKRMVRSMICHPTKKSFSMMRRAMISTLLKTQGSQK